MKTNYLPALISAAMLALLTACGGNASDTPADRARIAAPMALGPAPVADCEAEGCNQPRIIDGLAEQYRSSSSASEQPVDPAPAAAAPSAAAPAAAG